jgi:murein peptide amidase A
LPHFAFVFAFVFGVCLLGVACLRVCCLRVFVGDTLCGRRYLLAVMRPALVLLMFSGCVSFQPLGSARAGSPTTASDPIAAMAASPWQVVAHSVEGRPLRVKRLGRGPRRVLWIGGIHGDEREGSLATAELPAAFAAAPGAFDAVTLTILEDANPDGSAKGVRGNARGIDLNRNYPAGNFLPGVTFGQAPLDQPEARAVHDLVLQERPDLVLVAHAWRGDRFINFDGPAEPHAATFSRLSGLRVQPSDKIAPTPGSLGSWVGRTLGIPILTIEWQRGTDPLAAWQATRAAILAVVVG